MKCFVLMAVNTGELFLGYRITFMDKKEYATPLVDGMPKEYVIGMLTCDGWIAKRDDMPSTFMSLYSQKYFECLGEL